MQKTNVVFYRSYSHLFFYPLGLPFPFVTINVVTLLLAWKYQNVCINSSFVNIRNCQIRTVGPGL